MKHDLIEGKNHVRVIPWMPGYMLAIRVHGPTGVWASIPDVGWILLRRNR